MLLGIVVGRALRQPLPALKLPRPTSAQLSTMLAWLIIAGVAFYVVLTRHR